MNRLYAMLAAVLSFSAAAFALFKKGESAGKAEVITEAKTEALNNVSEAKKIEEEVRTSDEKTIDEELDPFMRD